MRMTFPQQPLDSRERSLFVSEGESASFAVPVRLGVRRQLPASPGRYLILLRQRHSARANRPWKWGRFIGEM